MRETTYVLAAEVAAGAGGYLKRAVRFSGRVDRVEIDFADGPRGTLHLVPVRLDSAQEQEQPLVEFSDSGDQYIKGNKAVNLTYPSDIPVSPGQFVAIRYANTGVAAHNVMARVVVMSHG